jgi:PIN domain nuclease of toxin-antitoxin system
MSAYLLDTNVVLFSLAAPERISRSIQKALQAGAIHVSVVSYWEVLLKSRKGRLDVGDPRMWWAEAIEKLAATPLPLRPDHVSALCDLPPFHQDPFDRALIAQALVERLTLVTSDGEMPRYRSSRFIPLMI